jgi:transposase
MNKTNPIISSIGNNRASVGHNGNKGVLRLGLDVHYRQVTAAMQEEGGRIKVVGKMGHEAFGRWIEKKLAEGWQIYSCYEAGASGYWLHRELERVGVKNLVVVPKAMGQGGKRQKTDRRDSAELADGLDCYLRGKDKALSVVAVPSVEEEEKRALIRYHRQIMILERDSFVVLFLSGHILDYALSAT